MARSLGIRLSEGTREGPPASEPAVVDGQPLDDAAIAAVIGRLPAFLAPDGAQPPFNWPVETLAPPRTGATIDVAFPAPEGPGAPTAEAGPLSVLRVQPEGPVAIAPFVTITFDQPMVPIGTVGQLATAAVPATITATSSGAPPLVGSWQWIGTRTLRFDVGSESVDRLPMATEFRVDVPAGTTSATGSGLAEALSFTFATPPVTVQSLQPMHSSLPLTPVFVARFDQLIDPGAVLATTTVTADGDRVEMRLATDAEIEADDSARAIVAAAPAGRWLAFRPVDVLPTDAAVEVVIGPGTPSAEGPLLTESASTHSGRTYAPLELTTVSCEFDTSCSPGLPIVMAFNNPLDLDEFDPAWVTAAPAIPGLVVGAYGSVIELRGATAPDTTYELTVSAELADTFGQRLGDATRRSIVFGPARPVLQPFEQPLTTLDPSTGSPTIALRTVNHDSVRVRVFEIEPTQWLEYLRAVSELNQADTSAFDPPDWPVAIDTELDTGAATTLRETPIDLAEVFGDEPGHAVVLVEPTATYSPQSDDYWSNRPTMTWVQSTALALDGFADQRRVVAWLTDLESGASRSGGAVGFLGADPVATDADGLVTLEQPSVGNPTLIATAGADSVLLPAGYYGELWQANPSTDELRWYAIDDRGVYRPGETVSVKAWIRRLTTSGERQLELPTSGATVTWTARDPQGNDIGSGSERLDRLGGFSLEFEVPASANLGYAVIDFTVERVRGIGYAGYSHQFQIQEFRRPEFEVTARPESAGPYVSSSPATVAVDAQYFAGGPLAAAPVNWRVSTAEASYSPPGWEGFTFGEWTPWWEGDRFAASATRVTEECCFPGAEVEVEEWSGTTDVSGTHYLHIDFGGTGDDQPDLPVTVSAEATVEDVNRQAWTSTANLLVHPAELYVGLRSARTFVATGEPLAIDSVVTDIDGTAVAGRSFTVVASRLEARFVNGEWVETEVDPQSCASVSASEPVACTFTTEVGGSYRIQSTVTDDDGGASHTELTRWVSGGEGRPSRRVTEEALTIVPDRETFEVGETARLLIQAPFSGEGLAIVARGDIVSTERFAVTDGAAVLDIPIAETDVPEISVAIEVVGSSPRTSDDGTPLPTAPSRPAFATGSITLPVSLVSRTLTVDATPRAETLAPGETTQLDIVVTDSTGAPVSDAELAVVVVDEAVLAVSGYTLGDPLTAFYSSLGTYLTTRLTRSTVELVDPTSFTTPADGSDDDSFAAETTAAAEVAEESAAGDPAAPTPAADASRSATGLNAGGGSAPIATRSNFDALAVFEPDVSTDARGAATVEVPLPDNLTRYRVMVVAASGATDFGSDEANITARLPLMVRPSAPRFANFGDAFDLPVIVQNQTDAAMDVDVVVETANLAVTGPAGKRVSVPANDRVEVRFSVATTSAGTATFRVAATSGAAGDSATTELPVYTPATAEAFATYGVLDDGSISQPVLAPTDVVPQFGGLEITTSSTALQALTDAVLYVTENPYTDSISMASRIIAIASLRDVLEAFAADGLPSAAQLDAALASDVAGLTALQNDDGGFALWERGRPSDPYQSIVAVHALALARTQAVPVPAGPLSMAQFYLSEIEQYFDADLAQTERDVMSAYALWVRSLLGDTDSAKAQRLWDDRGEGLPLDAIAWLWPLITDATTDAEIARLLGNRAVDTAGSVTFTESYSDAAYVVLASQQRTDALVLDALLTKDPGSDLVAKAVSGLLGNRKNGRWDDLQSNSFVLVALKHYFDEFEATDPDFVARTWLGERYAGEQSFEGRSTDRVRVTVPTAELIAVGNTSVVLEREGSGRLYYRLGLRYAPADLSLEPLDRGFVVQRTYEAVDDPSEVTRDADGTWRIAAGARVRVRVMMVAESQRSHAALIDPLPAGLEIMNPDLATTGTVPPDPIVDSDGPTPFDDRVWMWPSTWFEHQNQRDDRAEAFASLLPAGTYDYSYVARATTPGSFVVPPSRAEEMYAPETFGRGATDRVVIG